VEFENRFVNEQGEITSETTFNVSEDKVVSTTKKGQEVTLSLQSGREISPDLVIKIENKESVR
jgi:hypothetical protein